MGNYLMTSFVYLTTVRSVTDNSYENEIKNDINDDDKK